MPGIVMTKPEMMASFDDVVTDRRIDRTAVEATLAASRRERLSELMRFWTAAAARYPWVRMTDHAEAVAVWVPPGKPEMTTDEEARFATLVNELFGKRASELSDLFDRFDEHHPEEPHYYLSLWGTGRDYAGRGLGSTLIRDNLARIDAEGMPAYLESSNPRNITLYRRHGFEVVEELALPWGCPPVWRMWRG